MPSAKELLLKPIAATEANALMKRLHYSGSIVRNSQLHIGAFYRGKLEGALQFGPSMDKAKLQGLVSGTPWNGFIELNRMAFSDALPRNSESRALGIALRMLRRNCPQLQWVITFADGTQCGDGTIYRAAGFVLTRINPNKQIYRLDDGRILSKMTMTTGLKYMQSGGAKPPPGTLLRGFQLRYIFFLDPSARDRLAVPVIPFSRIAEIGAAMYRGQARAGGADSGTPPTQGGGGGASPTAALSCKQGLKQE